MRRPTHYLLPLLACLALPALFALAQPPAGGDVDAVQEKTIHDAVQKVAPSIVQIETSGGTDIIGGIRKGTGPTTGLVVSTDGYVISSAFNFANKPSDIFVAVPAHKKRYVAKVVATDTTRMLTLLQLLKLEPGDPPLVVPVAAPKGDIKIGHTAIALGRTLDPVLDHSPSVSVGIISALGRIWGKALQTDAKVSPANYGGPLVDLMGRVQGVLVPASPRADGETAGVEWYDSGIGFAIPLEDINAVLPRLKEGKDLQKGVLGINLQSQDIYGAAPVIQGVAPDSAAAKAGIKPGDHIVELDGVPVVRQAQILHVLGTKYEGDKVSVKIKRTKDGKDEELSFANLVLSAPLTAARSFLGILPMRDDPELGLEVRYIYPKSPAETAGLKVGDRIMKVGFGPAPMQPFSGSDELSAVLSMLAAGTDVKLEVTRKEGKKTETLTVKLGNAPETVPDKLPETASLKKALEPRKQARPMGPMPPMRPMPGERPMPPKKPEEKKDDKKDAEKKKPETGLHKRTNAAQDHQYWVYVPEDYDPNISYALLVWLHPVGKGKEKDMEDMQQNWEDYCKDNHMIWVAPKAENDTGWLGSEVEFVQEVINEVAGQYTIDRRRVVAHGMGIGGQMAFRMGFRARDRVRGVAVVGAAVGELPKETLSNLPLSFFLVAGEKDPLAKGVAESKAKLAEKKFSVIYQEIPERGHQYLDEKTLEMLVRWIDSLDHL